MAPTESQFHPSGRHTRTQKPADSAEVPRWQPWGGERRSFQDSLSISQWLQQIALRASAAKEELHFVFRNLLNCTGQLDVLGVAPFLPRGSSPDPWRSGPAHTADACFGRIQLQQSTSISSWWKWLGSHAAAAAGMHSGGPFMGLANCHGICS